MDDKFETAKEMVKKVIKENDNSYIRECDKCGGEGCKDCNNGIIRKKKK